MLKYPLFCYLCIYIMSTEGIKDPAEERRAAALARNPNINPWALSIILTDSELEATPDSRVTKIGTRELSGLHYKYLRLRSGTSEVAMYGKGIGRSERLMRLAEDEKVTLSKMRAEASAAGKAGETTEDNYMTEQAYQARTEYIRTSKKQKEIKALLLELGLAEMLLLGDWKVNREGGEKVKTRSPMPLDSELRRKILEEAGALMRAIDRKDVKSIETKANSIAWRMRLQNAKASAVAVALRELKKSEKSNIASTAKDPEQTDIAVSASLSDDIASSLGIVSFPEIENLILQFHNENGLLASTAPIKQGKLAALDVGCGNGVTAERLRRNPTDPFKNGRRLLNYWIEIGFADKIYWTLSDFICGLLRDEHKNDPAVSEFIEVVSRLLILRINNLKRYPPKKLHQYDKTILELATNPNIIRVILPNLDRYIRHFKGLSAIKADKEFELDSEHYLSQECKDLIKDFFEGPELFRGIGSENKSDPIFKDSNTGKKLATRAFLETYFREEAIEHNDKVEKAIVNNAEEIKKLDERYQTTTEEIKPINQRIIVLKEKLQNLGMEAEEKDSVKTELADLEIRFAELVKKREAIKTEKKRFTLEKENLGKKRATDLAGEIMIYPHNVILGDFSEFKTIMPEDPTFDWVRSWRASSHANDTQYAELMYECAKRLKSGGIITEDGQRESYTRFERTQELQDLQKKLGNQYQIRLIVTAKGPVGVLIERAIVKGDGEFIFFSEEKGKQLLRKDASLMPVDMFETAWPKMAVRNEIIRRLKGLFIDSALQNCAPEEVRTRTYHGRMQFRHLHRSIEACLEKTLLKTDDAKPQESVDSVWEVITSKINCVRRRIAVVDKGEILLQGDRAVIQTFSPRPHIENEAVAERRSCKAESLPRNLDVPDLSDPNLEQERTSLVATLTEIAKLTNVPALRLHLYDCFTDPSMLDTILTLLGANKNPEKEKLLEVVNVKIKGRYDQVSGEKIYNYPTQQDGVIDIFGGSTNDAYDMGGKRYIDEFMIPWLERIENGSAVRGMGICFGSQCMMEAIGKVKKFKVKTQKGALQFGPFPVVFGDRHVMVKHLANKACTGVFTRSGYSIPDNSYAARENLSPLAYEGKMDKDGIWLPDRDLPPVAYLLSNGRAITAQMHLEVSLKDSQHIKHMARYAGRHATDLAKAFGPNVFSKANPLASPNFLRGNHFSLQAQSISGENTNWIAKDIGMAFLIPSLLHLATDLLSELRKSKVEAYPDSPAPVQ